MPKANPETKVEETKVEEVKVKNGKFVKTYKKQKYEETFKNGVLIRRQRKLK